LPPPPPPQTPPPPPPLSHPPTPAGASTAQWPELLPAVFALAASPAAPVRAAALTAFTSIVEYVGHDGIGPHAATLGHMLPPLLGDADALVGVAALKVRRRGGQAGASARARRRLTPPPLFSPPSPSRLARSSSRSTRTTRRRTRC
jgi:hypothetical protein